MAARDYLRFRRPLLFHALLALLCLAGMIPSTAQTAPRTVVLLCDGLSVDDLHGPAMPVLTTLARRGQVALMNVARGSGPRDPAALLPLALGFLAPAESTDLDIHPADESPIERANAAVVFRRRTGIVVSSTPPAPLVHLGIAPLTRRKLNDSLLGAVLDRAGRRDSLRAAGLNGLRSGLFVVNGLGTGPAGFRAENVEELARWIAANRTSLVIDMGDGPGAKASLEALLARIPPNSARLLLVSPTEPSPGRLPLAILSGPGLAPGVLSSPTTRTRGLIANIDIAPTLLGWLGVRPPSTMTGHAIAGIETRDALDAKSRLDSRIAVNERALTPVFVLLGVIGIATLAGGLFTLRRARRAAPAFAFLVLALMNMPLALLISAVLPAPSVAMLAANSIALMGVLAACETALSRRLPNSFSPCVLASLATVAVIIVDAYLGQPLVKFSLLSGYQVEGIRFYGIGNEYMGVVLGMTLFAAFMTGMRPPAAAALFALVTLVVGSPRLGANAGGLIAAFVTFGCGFTLLRRRRAGLAVAIAWAILGLAAAFGLALLDRALPGATRAPSHLGGAMQAAGDRGYEYLWEIVRRKVLMNARIVQHPGVLTAMGTLALLAWAAGGALRRRVARLAAAHPHWARSLPAAGWGALAAFVFNDSGVVAALFLLGSSIVSGLAFLFSDPESSTISAVSRV